MENQFITLIQCDSQKEITFNTRYFVRFNQEVKGTRLVFEDKGGMQDICVTISYTDLNNIVGAKRGQ